MLYMTHHSKKFVDGVFIVMKRIPLFAFIIPILLAGLFLLSAGVYATADYNSSRSNTSTSLSDAGLDDEQIEKILEEFPIAINEEGLQEITINEDRLREALIEIGIGEEGVNSVLTDLRENAIEEDRVGIVIQNGKVAAQQDDIVTALDFGVGLPRILPGNPFYGFKNFTRGVRSFFTFNPEKKAELKLRFANEKIIEVAELAKKGDFQRVESHLKNYEKDIERAKKLVEKFAEKNPEMAEKFAEKALKYQLKHQILLEKFEKGASGEQLERIREIRGKVLEHTGEILGTIDDPEKMKRAVLRAIDERGSAFKPLRNLEVLKAVEEKVPEKAKEAIRHAQENSIKRFRNKFEALPDEERKHLAEYIEHVGGDETLYLKIFDRIKFAEIDEDAAEHLVEAKEKLYSRFENRLKEAAEKNPELAKQFFRHFEEGDIEDIRIIKDLERNIDPALTKHIIEAKEKAFGKFRDQIAGFDTPEKREIFFREKFAPRFSDLNQIELFEELEEVLPKEKQEIARDLKERMVEHMRNRLEDAKGEETRRARLRSIIGDSPEHLQILEGIRSALGDKISDDLISIQARHFEDRIEHIEDPGRLQLFKSQLEEREDLRSIIQQFRPEFFEKLEARELETQRNIGREHAQIRIEEAERRLSELSQKAEYAFDDLPDEERERFRAKLKIVFENSEEHLAAAKETFEQNNFGEAFGQATAALNALRSAEELIGSTVRLKLSALHPVAPTPTPEGQKRCGKYARNGISEEHCAICGNNICEPFETCTSSSCSENACTDDCGPLYCPRDCEKSEIRPCPSIDLVILTKECTAKGGTIARKFDPQCGTLPYCAIEIEPPLPTPKPEPVFCTQEFAPVCGVNGRTYSNRCIAIKQNRVEVAYVGKCKEEKLLEPIIKPIIEKIEESLKLERTKILEPITTEPTIIAPEPVSAEPTAIAPEPERHVIAYTNDGYSPRSLAIKAGATVTFVNKSSHQMWTASAFHPTHAVYPQKGGCIGSAFDACRGIAQGASWSFTFEHAGSWKYHNHLNPLRVGAIIVE